MAARKKVTAGKAAPQQLITAHQMREYQVELAKQQRVSLDRFMSGIERMATKYFTAVGETEKQTTLRTADANKHEWRTIALVIGCALAFGIGGLVAAIVLKEGSYVGMVVSGFFSFLGGFGFGRHEAKKSAPHASTD